MQMVCWCGHFWLTTVAGVFLSGSCGCHAGQSTNTSGLVLAPLQVDGEPCHTIQRVFGVGGFQLQDCLLVTLLENGVPFVQAGAAHANGLAETPLETWFDLVQCG